MTWKHEKLEEKHDYSTKNQDHHYFYRQKQQKNCTAKLQHKIAWVF